MVDQDFSTFLDSWSSELSSQANRIRQLIGSAHWLSDGNHKEVVLRAFLRRYLPTTLHVGSGFVLNPTSTRSVSPQIDILICDFDQQTPFLIEESLLISPPRSVVAHMEVKSKLTSEVTKDSFSNLFATRLAISPTERPPWSGIICFATDTDAPEKLCSWFKSALQNEIHLLQHNGTNTRPGIHAPICIVAVGAFIGFISDISETKARLRIFMSKEKSLALWALDLISTIRTQRGGRPVDDIDDLAGHASVADPIIFDLVL